MIELNCKKSLNGADGKFELDVNLNVKKGEFIALYGKSGSGKTTLLRLIAGFETPDSGAIKAGGKTLFEGKNFAPPQSRNIGFLFQDYALFPNMNVMKNLLFANNDLNLAHKLLDLVEMSSLENAAISQLSGGQKQRAALARALMRKPEILLLDEPLSALDNAMREKLQDYLAKIHAEFNMTTVLVSHDVAEIYKLASKVFVLENGKIAHIGSPSEIFLRHSGSQKFSLPAKILEISKRDAIYVAVVLVGQQLCEVALSAAEAANLRSDDEAVLSAKAFGLNLQKSGDFDGGRGSCASDVAYDENADVKFVGGRDSSEKDANLTAEAKASRKFDGEQNSENSRCDALKTCEPHGKNTNVKFSERSRVEIYGAQANFKFKSMHGEQSRENHNAKIGFKFDSAYENRTLKTAPDLADERRKGDKNGAPIVNLATNAKASYEFSSGVNIVCGKIYGDKANFKFNESGGKNSAEKSARSPNREPKSDKNAEFHGMKASSNEH